MTRIEYTKKMLDSVTYNMPLGLALNLWWSYPPGSKSLRLSYTGMEILRAVITAHKVDLPKAQYTGKIAIGLQRRLKHPYFLQPKETASGPAYIILFDEEDATLLRLIDGDLDQFVDMLKSNENF